MKNYKRQAKKSRQEKNSIEVIYWYGRWQSYKKLLSKISTKDEKRYPSRLLKIEDFLKLVETT
ncbi:hypothetical protein MUP77_13840, partial [Candidatus Bathyarchaeota archaeon]|nr:hypothetical protein [Candidatus Bathyarchaeota archaeon]